MRNRDVVVTGAFSYTGKYVTRLLLGRNSRVRTLTFHPERRNEFGGRVEVLPYAFEDPERLADSFGGASTLVNTYWVRFPRGRTTFDRAVRNTVTMIEAAKRAGIERVVHVSIANASRESPLAYFRAKALAEETVKNSGLSYTILRPTVLFGREDILINNMAWFVRHLPVFGIPRDGQYRVRPIYVEDMAGLLAESVNRTGNEVIDAVGPETFTFEELIRLIAKEIGTKIRIVHLPVAVAYLSTCLAGLFLRDVVLTREELKGLMAGLLAPEGPSVRPTRLTEWIAEHREEIGRRYASELARHYRPGA